MVPTKHVISEHGVVELRNDAGGWSIGTVVSDSGDDALVEVSDARGRTKGLVRVSINSLRPRRD